MLNIDCLKILAAENIWLNLVRNSFQVRLFIPCVKETYATTNKHDQTIRNMSVMATHKYMAYVSNREKFMDAFQDINAFQDMGEFTADLSVHVAPLLYSNQPQKYSGRLNRSCRITAHKSPQECMVYYRESAC
jgi:hypothetical protein